MIRVGLTGGYATGKSFVGSELERLGCRLIYADKLGHKVLEPGGDAYLPAVREFGSKILDTAGRIDRKKLGELVFGAPELLRKLTALVHPAVFRLEEQLLRSEAAANPKAIAVIEAAILIETGRFEHFDRIVLTTCSEEVQIARGIERDGLTEEQVRARLKEQMPFSEKSKYAHYIIDTGTEPEETIRQVRAVYRDLQAFNGRGKA